MNEILAPLFFVFRNDPDYKNAVRSKRLFKHMFHAICCRTESWDSSSWLWDYLYHDVVSWNPLQNFAEADSFFCFVELLSGFRDNFCQKLDNSAIGIRGTLSKLTQLLKRYDGELQHHLEITTEVSLYVVNCMNLSAAFRAALSFGFRCDCYQWQNGFCRWIRSSMHSGG